MAGLLKPEKRVKTSIRKRLFIVLLLVSILPVLLVTILTMYTMESTLYNQIIQNGKASIQNIHDKMEMVVQDYSQLFYDYEVNTDFKEVVTTWCNEETLDYSKQWQLITYLNTTMSVESSIDSIEMYNLCNGQVLTAKRTGAQLISDGSGHDAWAGRGQHMQTNTVFEGSGDEILVKHQMNEFETGKALVVIVMHIKTGAFENMLKEALSNDTDSLFLLNDSDRQILSITGQADKHLGEQVLNRFAAIKNRNSEEEPLFLDKQFLFAEPVSNGKLFVIQAVPEDIIITAMASALGNGVLVCAVCIVVTLLISFILSKIISNPIVALAETMKTLSVSDYEAEHQITREDEIGLLQKSFHSMIARNQDLINREYISKIEKNHAQIHALQAQINPHFLYNTLQVIGGMALKQQVSQIYSMTVALSDIMRYSLDFSKDMVPIREELKYLQSYLLIQKQRHQSNLEIEISIQDELMDFLIPKLILQPIIENSLEHGMKDQADTWVLKITGELISGNIMIHIKDNGVGMSQRKLLEIQRALADTEKVWNSAEHIGLSNVNMRLKLTYQAGYSLNIFSEEAKGTTVEIVIEAVKEALS